jgi:Flp pilus assembly protein protease CpaA
MAMAGICDLRARKIPNSVVVLAAASGLLVQFWAGGVLFVAGGMSAAAATVLLLFPFWKRGGMGGGDVKLAGAAAIWVGLRALPTFALATALAGGATALVCLLLSKRETRLEIQANLTMAAFHHEIPSVPPAGAGRVSVPYAVAIAVGVACACRWPSLF